MTAAVGPVTELLQAMSEGREDAAHAALPLVYAELRAIAAAHMAQERRGHTLSPTALVHEAWLRLVAGPRPDYRDRRHFLAIAAVAMRRVLIDHARGTLREKRGGGQLRVTLGTDLPVPEGDPAHLLALDDALERLAMLDPQMARVVELRWFGGLTVEEAADVLGISPRGVNRAWTAARAWLARELDT